MKLESMILAVWDNWFLPAIFFDIASNAFVSGLKWSTDGDETDGDLEIQQATTVTK